jgi:hypothetical protein
VLFAPNGILIAGLGEKAANLLSDSLFMFKDGKWQDLTALPAGERFRCGYFSVGRRLYIGWGKNQNGQILPDWWVYDIPAGIWDTLSAPADEAREWCSSTGNFRGGGAIGFGMNASEIFLNDVYYFNPLSNTWRNIHDYEHPLRGAALVGTSNELHIFTGLDDQFQRRALHARLDLEISERKKIRVFPNPANTYIHIRHQAEDSSLWQLVDISGRIIREFECHNASCEISLFGIKPGIYFIGNSSVQEKIIVR